MQTLREWIARFWGTLHPRRRDGDLEHELRVHQELAAEHARRRDRGPDDSVRVARIAGGGASQAMDALRDQRGLPWLDDLARDVRHALRMLGRSPAFTTVVLVTLAVGLGANTAIFSLTDALVLKTLPVNRPHRLYFLKRDEPALRSFSFPALPDLARYRGLTQVLSSVSGIVDVDRSNITVEGATGPNVEQIRIGLVSGNYFSTIGVGTAIGRVFAPEDDRAGANPVVVISDAYGRRHFARSGDAVGRVLTINGTTYTIIGVTPARFSGDWVGHATDMWAPLSMYGMMMFVAPTSPVQVQRVVARLAADVTPAQAQAAIDVVAPQLARDYLAANPQLSAAVRAPLQLRVVLSSAARGFSPQRDALAPALRVLTLLVGLVLAVACLNVANLLLGRAVARQREMAVRLALGAGVGRVVRQLLTESVLLASMGGALGFLFALWATEVLAQFLGTGSEGSFGLGSTSLDLQVDMRLLAFTAGLSLLTGIAFGLAPALRASRRSLASTLTRPGLDAGGRRFGVMKMLVIAQIAVSLLLLIMAGLFVRTLQNLRGQNLGYDREHLLLVWTSPAQSGRRGPDLVSLVEQIEQRIPRVPGVASVNVSTAGLLNGLEGNSGPSTGTRLEGQPPKPGLLVTRTVVSPGFFATAGLRMVAGRDFTERDTDTAPPVVIVNETLARFEFGRESAVGKHIGILNDVGTPREIIAVVTDAKYNTAREQNLGMLYLIYRQRPTELGRMCIVVRSNADPGPLASSVKRELRDVDPELPVLSVDTLDRQLDLTLVRERLLAALAESFGALALLLAGVGLYGVVAQRVVRRTNEIGLRMALGADRRSVLWMILRDTVVLAGAGLAVGVPIALGGTRLASAQLYGIGSADPTSFSLSIGILASVAVLAGLTPAVRASRVDPMIALRCE